MDIIDIVLSKKYTDESLKGITGTLAGKNCTIKSATKADGVTTVVFAWTADDGTEKTTTIQVNDGNNDYEDLINMPKIEGVELIGNKTFEDLGIASATDLAQTDEYLQNLADLVGDKANLPMPNETVVGNIKYADTKIDSLKGDLDDINKAFVRSKNKLNEKEFEKDKAIYASGMIGSQVGTYLSPKIDVSETENITVMLNGISIAVNPIRSCFYTGETPVATASNNLYPNSVQTFQVPNGANTFRFSMPESYYEECISNGMMVENGVSYSGYEPFGAIYATIYPSAETIKARGEYAGLNDRLDAMQIIYHDIFVGESRGFKTLRSAIESIAESVNRNANTKSNYHNRYNIYIDSGEYDILSEFTFDELSTTSFEGIYIPDYVNLYGVGNVLLFGDWDNYMDKFSTDSEYYNFVVSRHVVCPINTHKNCIMKDIIIQTHNMRYCLHDEDAGVYYDSEQIFENCKFIALEANPNVRARIYATPVGIGISNRKITFKNCEFISYTQSKQALFFHDHATAKKASEITLDSCMFTCGIAGHSIICTSYGEDTSNKVIIKNCGLKDVIHTRIDGYSGECDFDFVGGGNTDFMYSFDNPEDVKHLKIGAVYCKNNSSQVIPKGAPVRLHNNNLIMPFTTSSETAVQFYGITLEDIQGNGYGLIKTNGMISASDTTLGTSSVGSLIGIVSKTIGVVTEGHYFGICPFDNWVKIIT